MVLCQSAFPQSTGRTDSRQVLVTAEQMPEFKGGTQAMMKFLHDNIHYPDSARAHGVEGRVLVTFVVNPDGRISGVTPIGAPLGYGCEQEAVRVVRLMPKWVPGMQDGKPVAVKFNLPVRFSMQ